MKKRVLLLLPLFLGACSDSGESPVIKIEKLYAKIESDGENTSSDEKDYANQREELPALKVGDEVKAFLLLDGNGAVYSASYPPSYWLISFPSCPPGYGLD